MVCETLDVIVSRSDNQLSRAVRVGKTFVAKENAREKTHAICDHSKTSYDIAEQTFIQLFTRSSRLE